MLGEAVRGKSSVGRNRDQSMNAFYKGTGGPHTVCPPVLLFLPSLPVFFHSSQEPVRGWAKYDRHKEDNNPQLPPPDGKYRLTGNDA